MSFSSMPAAKLLTRTILILKISQCALYIIQDPAVQSDATKLIQSIDTASSSKRDDTATGKYLLFVLIIPYIIDKSLDFY